MPSTQIVGRYDVQSSSGMPLRDYIAIHATNEDIEPFLYRYSRAEARYKFANSMLKVRKK